MVVVTPTREKQQEPQSSYQLDLVVAAMEHQSQVFQGLAASLGTFVQQQQALQTPQQAMQSQQQQALQSQQMAQSSDDG